MDDLRVIDITALLFVADQRVRLRST